MTKEINNNKISYIDENNKEIMFIDNLNDECIVWFFSNSEVIKITKDIDLYNPILDLMNGINKLIIFSDYSNIKLTSYLTIEKKNNYIELYSTNPLDKYNIRNIKSNVILFNVNENNTMLKFYKELLNKNYKLIRE